MRLVLPAVLRVILLAFLAVSSAAILYATVMNERTVESLADQSLESTALALSSATESALRAGGGGSDSEVQGILSDRVVAYALIAEGDGMIRFHTNPRMMNTRLPRIPVIGSFGTGQPSGRRVVLGGPGCPRTNTTISSTPSTAVRNCSGSCSTRRPRTGSLPARAGCAGRWRPCCSCSGRWVLPWTGWFPDSSASGKRRNGGNGSPSSAR